VGGDQRVDGAAKLTEHTMRAPFVQAHKSAETDHICMQNGGEFPVPTTNFQNLSHRSPEKPKPLT
jgi:hypothetical protein